MKTFTILLLLFSGTAAFSQVGIGTETPHPSAQLDVSSNNKGVLIPRVLQANRPDINTNPPAAKGLMIYQTDGDEGFYVYNGWGWEKVIYRSDIPAVFNQIYATNDNDFTVSAPRVWGSKIPFNAAFGSSWFVTTDWSESMGTLQKAGLYRLDLNVTPKEVTGNKYIAYIICTNCNTLTPVGFYSSDTNIHVSGTVYAYLNVGSKYGILILPQGDPSTAPTAHLLFKGSPYPTRIHTASITLTYIRSF